MKKTRTRNYKYNVGITVNGLKILKHVRIDTGIKVKAHQKGYLVKCIKDNYEYKVRETDITSGAKCPVCCNQKVLKGVNDIATTNPEYIPYFVNLEDAYNYSYGSGRKKVKIQCPLCGEQKYMTINTLTNIGFSCPKCGDGVSYPEKFMYNLLRQLNVDFDKQSVFNWSQNKIYDFYIPLKSCIIEIHGAQHYFEGFGRIKGGRTLKEEKTNDMLKEKLAKENNIKNYIVIDCRESDIEWIKDKILESNLKELLNLNDINWMDCHQYACSNLVRIACNYWCKDVKNTFKIGELMGLDNGTVRKYLKQGEKIGWCDYSVKEIKKRIVQKMHKGNKKKIICITTNIIYDSLKDAFEKTGVNMGNISECCSGKREHAGRDKDTGLKLKWKYI